MISCSVSPKDEAWRGLPHRIFPVFYFDRRITALESGEHKASERQLLMRIPLKNPVGLKHFRLRKYRSLMPPKGHAQVSCGKCIAWEKSSQSAAYVTIYFPSRGLWEWKGAIWLYTELCLCLSALGDSVTCLMEMGGAGLLLQHLGQRQCLGRKKECESAPLPNFNIHNQTRARE